MNILWLKTELLHPVDKGGKIRTYQMLKELRKEHNILYLTLDDGTCGPEALDKADEYANETIVVPHSTAPKFSGAFYRQLGMNLFSDIPYFMAKYRSREMRERFERVSAKHKVDVVVCDFLMPSINLPESTSHPTLLFQHNVEAAIWKRHADVATNLVKKRYLRSQWRRTVRYERSVCRRFDSVVAVSSDDAAVFSNEYGAANVRHIPTGVDTEFFSPGSSEKRPNANIVFTGSMDWLPNQDAMDWFIGDVLPIVRSSRPETTLTVVGRDPFPKLVEMSRRDPAIKVTGRVADVRPFMREASVYVAPIRIGGGTRLKLYEAMGMELPIISTTVGAEGLPVSDGVELLLRDSPEEFAAAIVNLFHDPENADRLGKRAGERVRRDFGWKHVADKFAAICEETIRRSNR